MQPEDMGVAEFYEIMFEHWGSQLRELHAARQARKGKESQPESSDPILIEDDDGDCDAIIELEKKSLTNAENGFVVAGSEVLEDLVWGQFDWEDAESAPVKDEAAETVPGAEAAKEEVTTEEVAGETSAAHSSAAHSSDELQSRMQALRE